jgi:hypothetical protein
VAGSTTPSETDIVNKNAYANFAQRAGIYTPGFGLDVRRGVRRGGDDGQTPSDATMS